MGTQYKIICLQILWLHYKFINLSSNSEPDLHYQTRTNSRTIHKNVDLKFNLSSSYPILGQRLPELIECDEHHKVAENSYFLKGKFRLPVLNQVNEENL